MSVLPPALLAQLHSVPGFDEASFLAAHSMPAVTSVRVNKAKDSGLFTQQRQVPWCNNAVYLPERPVFTLDPSYHAGAYYVQEASSMFLAHIWRHLLQGRTGLRVLDLCAAPGGKSTLVAGLLDEESLLVSNEVIRTRASILEENMTRWGCTNTWVTSNDPRDFAKLPGYFDVIVADAPCSGSGLFRKDERALDEWSENNVQLCSERQQRILADVWPSLKEDGILIYATCSYSQPEDEEILDWLSAEYEVETLTVSVPAEWGITTVQSPLKNATGYRFFPGKVDGEGFFIAALQKKGETDTIRLSKFRSADDKKIRQAAGHLLGSADLVFLQTGKEHYNAIYKAHEPDLQLLQKAVYTRKAGVLLGEPSSKEWLPAHDVALSIQANGRLPGLDVTREEALRFLKREDMGIDSLLRGWLMIRYKGLGLGWVKGLGNRMNNYLPKHWRIRMDITDSD